MNLTVEERQAVENGDVLKYVIAGYHVEYVIENEGMLDPLRVRLDYSECDPDHLAVLTGEVFPDEDWSIPGG